MAHPMDLRVRVLATTDEGLSRRAAAVRLGIASPTAVRWFGLRRATGCFVPGLRRSDMRHRRFKKRASAILGLWEAHEGISLEELCLALDEMGLVVSVAVLHRFFVRRGTTRKRRLTMPSSRTEPRS